MFTRLERNACAVLVVLALCAAVVLASPARAQAQATSTAEDTQGANANARASTWHMVVRPGDSLWSVSEERLGPNATPRRIMDEAERIYVLNRARIGDDPDLLFVGQELLVPPAMSERPAGAKPTRKTAEAAEAGTRNWGAKGTMGKASRAAPIGGDTAGVEVPKTGTDREPKRSPILPDVAEAAPVPDVGAVAANDAQPLSVASFFGAVRTEVASAASALTEAFFEVTADARREGRLLLGLGILVLTLVVAALMAWKLPMTRTIREDDERWGMSSGYYGETTGASRISPFAYHPGSLGDRNEQGARPEALSRGLSAAITEEEDPFAGQRDASRPASEVRGQSSGGSKNGGTASEDRFAHVGLFAIARAKRERVRRKQPPGLREPSRQHRVLVVRKRETRSSLRQQVAPRYPGKSMRRRGRTEAVTVGAASKGTQATRPRDEWEPSKALRSALEGLPIGPETGNGERMARLKPHLEEALRTLGRLERQGGLSDKDLVRKEACRRMLLMVGKGSSRPRSIWGSGRVL